MWNFDMQHDSDCNFEIANDGSKAVIILNKEFFEKECVLFICSKHADRFFLNVWPDDTLNAVRITLMHKDGAPIAETEMRQFMNECIDQQVRLDLQKEFGRLRQTIVDYAFRPLEKSNG